MSNGKKKLSTDRVRKFRVREKGILGEKIYKKTHALKVKNYRLRKKLKQQNEELNKPSKQEVNTTGTDSEPPVTSSCIENVKLNGPGFQEFLSIPGNKMTTKHMVFLSPFRCIVSGPSQSGKSTFVSKFIKHKDEMCNPPIQEVHWFYGIESPQLKGLVEEFPFIKVHSGMPQESWLRDLDTDTTRLIVLDDLMYGSKDGTLSNLFTRTSHHANISCMFLVQNLFNRHKDMRDAFLNSSYKIIFKNATDKLQLNILSQRIFGKKQSNFLSDIMEEISEDTSYGYIALDHHPTTPDILRVRSAIFPGEGNDIYIPCEQ